MIGIILLNLGGPDSLESIGPFLYNLFSDRDIIRLGPSFLQKPIASFISKTRSKKTMAMYAMIGGKSPILEITTAQARELEKLLNQRLETSANSPIHQFTDSPIVRVYLGMRYWHPFIGDTLDKMQRDGVEKILALGLYPHYSIATTGSSERIFKEAAEKRHMEYFCAPSWFNHPVYIDALVEKIREKMKDFQNKPVVLFSAHSLPQKFIDEGDPYANEIRGTIEAVLKKIDIQWHLSYQSKSGPVKWLAPSTEHKLEELAGKGVKDLLVVPISFVSDHIETLYEIDILYKNMAQKLGINLKRAESLNTSPKFIEALKDIVITNMKEWDLKSPEDRKRGRQEVKGTTF